MTFFIPRKTYYIYTKGTYFSFPSFILVYIKIIVKVAVSGCVVAHTTNGNIKNSNPTKFERANTNTSYMSFRIYGQKVLEKLLLLDYLQWDACQS